MKFQREERYVVTKRKNLTPYQETMLRAFLQEYKISTVECAVVESDWPIYNEVWDLIEHVESQRYKDEEL